MRDKKMIHASHLSTWLGVANTMSATAAYPSPVVSDIPLVYESKRSINIPVSQTLVHYNERNIYLGKLTQHIKMEKITQN